MTRVEALRLLKAAAAASRQAHAPYSKFHVGAALLVDGGQVVTGCNVENASYGLTICAERSAIFTAVGRGLRRIKAVAVVASGEEIPFPCGACRQVLAEFCGPDVPVLIAPRRRLAAFRTITMGELLPHAFHFKK